MADERPNILLITSDQQHHDTLGVTNPRIKTPALDRLAAEGTRFDRAYCNNPVCSPSRASIITGLYPSWHHCWTIGVKLPEDVPTVGDIFQREGYYTALVGKAHFQPVRSQPGSESIESLPNLRDLDFWRDFHGPFYGFEHLELARNHGDEALSGAHHGIWMEEKGLANWRDYFRPWPPDDKRIAQKDRAYVQDERTWKLPQEYHYTTWTGERTVANIEQAAAEGKPFFIWSSYHDPHPPYIVPEPWATMYDPSEMIPGRLTSDELAKMPPHFAKTQEEKPDFSMYRETHGAHGFSSHLVDEETLRKNIAVYYGMISFMDYQIGLTLETLDRLGIAEDTLVLFSTDHGHFLGQHGLVAKGAFHYEDMVKLPMLVRWPGRVPKGRTSSALQAQVDYAPTWLEACGVEVPGYMQGLSQLGVWTGQEVSARTDVIVENRHEPTLVHARTYVDERYKVTLYRDRDYGEIFDLEKDPGEVDNLWDSPDHLELKCELLRRFMLAEIRREPTRMPRVAGA